jgi:hypothetical protein
VGSKNPQKNFERISMSNCFIKNSRKQNPSVLFNRVFGCFSVKGLKKQQTTILQKRHAALVFFGLRGSNQQRSYGDFELTELGADRRSKRGKILERK